MIELPAGRRQTFGTFCWQRVREGARMGITFYQHSSPQRGSLTIDQLDVALFPSCRLARCSDEEEPPSEVLTVFGLSWGLGRQIHGISWTLGSRTGAVVRTPARRLGQAARVHRREVHGLPHCGSSLRMCTRDVYRHRRRDEVIVDPSGGLQCARTDRPRPQNRRYHLAETAGV